MLRIEDGDMLRLIDPTIEYEVEISGSVFKIKQMDWGTSLILIRAFAKITSDDADFNLDSKQAIDKCLINQVVSISTGEDPATVIPCLDFKSIMKLYNKLCEISSLSGEEKKT